MLFIRCCGSFKALFKILQVFYHFLIVLVGTLLLLELFGFFVVIAVVVVFSNNIIKGVSIRSSLNNSFARVVSLFKSKLILLKSKESIFSQGYIYSLNVIKELHLAASCSLIIESLLNLIVSISIKIHA